MSGMTPKERILSAIKGREVDRVPWSPFLAYYWEHLPDEDRACGQLEYMKRMGADPLLRGFDLLYRAERKGCEHTHKRDGRIMIDTYTTKVGTLTEVRTYSPAGNTWFLTGHPVKNEEDFRILQYMMENTVITENLAGFEAGFAALGEDAVTAPSIGLNQKTAFQAMVEHWCGTEQLVYALCDYPETVEECLDVIRERNMETVRISLQSSAEVFNFFEDSSTTNISPDMFEEYTAPEINTWGRAIHGEGKLLMHHACGHLKGLLPKIAETEIDILESISPPPTGNVDIAECAERLPEHIALIGGIEPTFFRNCTMDELEARVKELLTAMKGKRYVLANSDSCPPGVAYEKFLLVSELVRKYC